ncbi:MAG: hypothetical protein IT378_16150 [Sandaracinaceae bacterium]|nr:hypothetical protein [Sandaracinaceae bacterium]
MLTSVLAVAGCSVVHDPGMHQAPPLPPSSVCTEFAQVICDAKARCCPTGSDALCRGLTIAACDAALSATIQAPENGYDPAAGGRQLNYLAQLAATCDPEYFAHLRTPQGVFQMFRGTAAGGGSCTDGGGTVQPFACLDDNQACLPTLTGSYLCGDLVGVEQPCVGSFTCIEGLYCESRPIAGDACVPRLAPGSACTLDDQCEALACVGNACLDPADSAEVAQAYCNPGF